MGKNECLHTSGHGYRGELVKKILSTTYCFPFCSYFHFFPYFSVKYKLDMQHHQIIINQKEFEEYSYFKGKVNMVLHFY